MQAEILTKQRLLRARRFFPQGIFSNSEISSHVYKEPKVLVNLFSRSSNCEAEPNDQKHKYCIQVLPNAIYLSGPLSTGAAIAWNLQQFRLVQGV